VPPETMTPPLVAAHTQTPPVMVVVALSVTEASLQDRSLSSPAFTEQEELLDVDAEVTFGESINVMHAIQMRKLFIRHVVNDQCEETAFRN